MDSLIEEIMVENFPNLGKKTQVQDAHRVPKKRNPTRLKPRHISIKMAKVKDNLERSKRKTSSQKQRKPLKAFS